MSVGGNFKVFEDKFFQNGMFGKRYKIEAVSRRNSLNRGRDEGFSEPKKNLGSGNFANVLKVKEEGSERLLAVKVMMSEEYEGKISDVPLGGGNGDYDFDEPNEKIKKENISSAFNELRKAQELKRVNLGSDMILTYHFIWMEEMRSRGGKFFTYIFMLIELGVTDLCQALQDKKLTPNFDDCCRLLNTIAICLYKVGERGYEHGDLKTDNLIVMDLDKAFTHSRGICISDFGISSESYTRQPDIEGLKRIFNELASDRICPELKEISGFLNLKRIDDVKPFLKSEFRRMKKKRSALYHLKARGLFEDLEEEVEALREDNDVLKGNYNDLKGKYDELKGEYNELKGEYNELKGNYDDLKGEFNELKGNYDELKGNYDDLKGKYEDLIERLDNMGIGQYNNQQQITMANTNRTGFDGVDDELVDLLDPERSGKKRDREEVTDEEQEEESEVSHEPPMKKRKLD